MNNLDARGRKAGIFTVHLQVNLASGGRREEGPACAKTGDASHPHVAMGRDCEQVFEISERIRAFKQHQLELIVEEGGAPRDLQIAAVVANTAGQREARLDRTTFYVHRKLGQMLANFGEAA